MLLFSELEIITRSETWMFLKITSPTEIWKTHGYPMYEENFPPYQEN